MGRGRERDKRGQEETTEMWGIGPYRYFFFPTSSPGEGYGLVVVVPRCLCATGLSLFHTHLIYCSVGVVRQVLSVVKYDNICMIIVVYRPYTHTYNYLSASWYHCTYAIRHMFQNFVQNEVHNLHVTAIKYSLPNLHKSSMPPKLHWIW